MKFQKETAHPTRGRTLIRIYLQITLIYQIKRESQTYGVAMCTYLSRCQLQTAMCRVQILVTFCQVIPRFRPPQRRPLLHDCVLLDLRRWVAKQRLSLRHWFFLFLLYRVLIPPLFLFLNYPSSPFLFLSSYTFKPFFSFSYFFSSPHPPPFFSFCSIVFLFLLYFFSLIIPLLLSYSSSPTLSNPSSVSPISFHLHIILLYSLSALSCSYSSFISFP